jgi:DNA mismatch repair protein MutL
MGVIHKLSKEIIPKIAAGEVIEGPSGAVKELVENSIDAGAKKITIEVSGSGFDKIRITDDGCGISKEDLLVCFQPFYTSKITNIDDLSNIVTLGFRGEALSSICAVSAVSIKSRETSSEYGTAIEVREGTIVNESSLGMNAGTIIEISGLFKNIPARRKFFKEPKAEWERLLEIIYGYALSNPDITFQIYRDGKLINSLKKDTLKSRIRTLLGTSAFNFLIPIDAKDDHVVLSGFISKPQGASTNASNQFLFVNNRFIKLKDFTKAIKSAYGTLLPHDVYPPFVLFVSLNPNLIDVNVHPKKLEVRFWDNEYVLNFVATSVKNILQNTDLTYVLGDSSNYRYDKSASSETFSSFKDATPLWKADDKPFELYETTFQIDNTYIATPVKEGLLLVDQHAAHESILYNELYESFITKKKSQESISLVPPLAISLGLKDATFLANNLSILETYGIELYQTGANTFTVTAIPELLKNRDLKLIIGELLSDVTVSGQPKEIDALSQKTLAFLACRSAIKAGDYLAPHEQKNILHKLDECSDIYTCPHGRPVKIVVTNKELAKFFKRIK